MSILWHLTIAVAMVLLSACAAVSPERTALEESTRRASNSADHLAIAEQYEVFARRATTLSLDYDARARTQEYLDALGGSNRPSMMGAAAMGGELLVNGQRVPCTR